LTLAIINRNLAASKRDAIPSSLFKWEDFPVEYEAYCVKCKAKTGIKDPQKVTMKNGREAIKGFCEKCGTGVYRILGKAK